MVSVKAAATGSVSWSPMVRGLGPLEHPENHTKTKIPHKHQYRTCIYLFIFFAGIRVYSQSTDWGKSWTSHTIQGSVWWAAIRLWTRGIKKKTGRVLPVHALMPLQSRRNSTHLQKLNETCRGQTIPEAARPLGEQTHEEDRSHGQGQDDDEEWHTACGLSSSGYLWWAWSGLVLRLEWTLRCATWWRTGRRSSRHGPGARKVGGCLKPVDWTADSGNKMGQDGLWSEWKRKQWF